MRDVLRMEEAEAWRRFRKLRWPETDGAPVCPRCACTARWDCARSNGAPPRSVSLPEGREDANIVHEHAAGSGAGANPRFRTANHSVILGKCERYRENPAWMGRIEARLSLSSICSHLAEVFATTFSMAAFSSASIAQRPDLVAAPAASSDCTLDRSA